jgi:hypothetical protein
MHILYLALLLCEAPPPDGMSVGTICGPQCVHYLLRHYGNDADLAAIVYEMQSNETDQGTTIKSVCDALHSRGINTSVLKLRPGARITWSSPVVVLLPSESRDAIGHYVVWLPSSSLFGDSVWDGYAPARMARTVMSYQDPPVIILTSKDQIRASDVVKASSFDRAALSISVAAFLVASLVYVAFRMARNRSWFGYFPSKGKGTLCES